MRFRKKKGLTDNVVAKNDNISQLNNDKNYADYERVKKIICEVVTADFIEAANAKFTNAQIEQLVAGNIQVKGAVTAEKIEVVDPSTGEVLLGADGTKVDSNNEKTVIVAGWKVNNKELDAPNDNVALYSGSSKTHASLVNSGSTSAARIMAGSNVPANAKFLVLDDGSVYATAGEFSNSAPITGSDFSGVAKIGLSGGIINVDAPLYKFTGAQASNQILLVHQTFMWGGRKFIYATSFDSGISYNSTTHLIDTSDVSFPYILEYDYFINNCYPVDQNPTYTFRVDISGGTYTPQTRTTISKYTPVSITITSDDPSISVEDSYITVSNATKSFNASTRVLTVSNPTGNVVVDITIPE